MGRKGWYKEDRRTQSCEELDYSSRRIVVIPIEVSLLPERLLCDQVVASPLSLEFFTILVFTRSVLLLLTNVSHLP